MKIRRPEDAHRIYVDAFNSGSVEAVLSLYEQDATFVPQPGQVLSGLKAIGEALQQFQSQGAMTAETRYCITCGDVALASATWQIKGSSRDGNVIKFEGTSAEVLRRQSDGHWLFAVDHPFGAS
jgi:uncharacterized protein (TIGR02246 family)